MTRVPDLPTVALSGGAELPLVGLGTWSLRGRDGYRAVRHALDTGYRHLDTATTYGNESEVGRAVRDSGVPRDQVFLTTKLPPDAAGLERETIEASLAALGTDYVDLWLVHWPPRHGEGIATWQRLLGIRDEGLARAVGVSNHSPHQLDELTSTSGEAPAVNQIPWSPSRYDAGLVAAHRQRGVVLEGYSPLKGSRLSDPTLTAIASAHGVTPARVVLRWHLEHGVPVIPKSARLDRIASNFDLFGFALSAEEVARIDALSAD